MSASLSQIAKQLDALAQPFGDVAGASFQMKTILNEMNDAARAAKGQIAQGGDNLLKHNLRLLRDRVGQFDAHLVTLQAAIRAAMASSVMDEHIASETAIAERQAAEQRDGTAADEEAAS